MKLRPGKRYTGAQLRALINQAEAHELQMQGYVLQHDVMSGTYMIVPWTEAGGGADFGQLRTPRVYAGSPDFGTIEPLRKRTAQERKDSLVSKWFEGCRAAGTIPGLSDQQVSDILGEDWKTGEREFTASDVERLAAVMLQRSEDKHEEKLSKQITRHED